MRYRYSGSSSPWSAGQLQRAGEGDSRGGFSHCPAAYFYRSVKIVRWSQNLLQPVDSMLDLGVGDGCQMLMLLKTMPQLARVWGLDVSRTIVNALQTFVPGKEELLETFQPLGGELDVQFFHYDGFVLPAELERERFDVVLSLQVIMHLLEDELFEAYMRILFSLSKKYVIIQNDNVAHPTLNHLRGWRFTDWVERNAQDWRRLARAPMRSLCPEDTCNRTNDALWLYAHKSLEL
ncbi:unnamed protein product [Polarella glacialis]|uniref:Methyltransferase type 11 domain-containing protein n=1 Tax=Polarella glacialis TaxID=89957 RepID=A0A813EWN3_POLGL|nr:unnamed protein product [Polarella glacialis]